MATRVLVGLAPEVEHALYDEYVARLSGGQRSDQVLALLTGPARYRWRRRLEQAGLNRGDDRIWTPGGWIRQDLLLWWPAIEPLLPPAAAAGLVPEIVQVDVSQALARRFLADYLARSGAFDCSRTPEAIRFVQLLDALSRGVENCLSTDSVGERLLAGATNDADRAVLSYVQPCLDWYRQEMIRHRLLDQALAWEVYANCLLPLPAYGAYLSATIKVLLVEAIDEASPLLLNIIDILAGYAEQVVAGERVDGGVRVFLGADPGGGRQRWSGALRTILAPEEPTMVATGIQLAKSLSAGGFLGSEMCPWPQATPVAGTAGVAAPDLLPPKLEARREGAGTGEASSGVPEPSAGSTGFTEPIERSTILEMLAAVVEDLEVAIARYGAQGVALIAPAVSPLVRLYLRDWLAARGLLLHVVAGSHRLLDDGPCRRLLALAQLAFYEAPPAKSGGLGLTRDEWLDLLIGIIPADPFAFAPLADLLASSADLPPLGEVERLLAGTDFGSRPLVIQGKLQGYQRLREWLQSMRAEPPDLLAEVFRSAFGCVLGPGLVITSDSPAPEGPRNPPGSLWSLSRAAQFISIAERFVAAMDRLDRAAGRQMPAAQSDQLAQFMAFLQEGTISERPFFERETEEAGVLLATASQFAQAGSRVDCQFWLDCSSPAWWKSDARELSNPRVLAVDRPLGPYGPQEDCRDQDSKLARVVLACCSRARHEIRAYASRFSFEGQVQSGGLLELLEALRGTAG